MWVLDGDHNFVYLKFFMAFLSIDQFLKWFLIFICDLGLILKCISLEVQQNLERVDFVYVTSIGVQLFPDATENKANEENSEDGGDQDLLPNLEGSALPKVTIVFEELFRSFRPILIYLPIREAWIPLWDDESRSYDSPCISSSNEIK